MLTALHIRNFKAWRDTGPVRLAPLTVIFGANSAGKSSLGHLLLALKQTAISTDRKRPLQLGDENSLIDLGTFAECLFNHDLKNSLGFDLSWRLTSKLEVRNTSKDKRFAGDNMTLSVELAADQRSQPHVEWMSYHLCDGDDARLSVTFDHDEKGSPQLLSDEYVFVRTHGRKWPLEEPDKFYRISDQTRARFQNADFLADFAFSTEATLDNIFYLGPLRDHPRRMYSWSGDSPESTGQRGEFAVAAILAAKAENRMLSRGLRKRQYRFDEFVAQWLTQLGIIADFRVEPVAVGRKEFEVLVRTSSSTSEVKITDVGFGVSQVLPAIVQAFYAPPNSTVWMEQPEIHLHPQVQAELADVFISAVQARENGRERNVQLIVESHSEHFLNRLQRRVAEGVLEAEDIAIYFVHQGNDGAEIEPLRLNMFGEIENWPRNFFGDEMADLSARTIAAMNKRKDLSQKEARKDGPGN